MTHREDDLPEDRFHDSSPTLVTVTVPGEEGPGARTATEFLIAMSRRVDSDQDWAFVGPVEDAPSGLTLSVASARRLAQELLQHLAGPWT